MSKKQATYCKYFDDENKARQWCSMKNGAARRAQNFRDIYCLVDGPSDDYAIVDLVTAIDLGFGYEICD